MLRLGFEQFCRPIRQVLCLGAHCDDLETGCGGAVLKLGATPDPPAFTWVVLSSDAIRRMEALRSAEALLSRMSASRIVIKKFPRRLPALHVRSASRIPLPSKDRYHSDEFPESGGQAMVLGGAFPISPATAWNRVQRTRPAITPKCSELTVG